MTQWVTFPLLTVVEDPAFSKRADALLSNEERDDLITLLASRPEIGKIVVGAGGIRKLRFAAGDRGKSGGVRVVYYFHDRGTPVFALLLYGKNEQLDLSSDQRLLVRAFAKAIKAERRKM